MLSLATPTSSSRKTIVAGLGGAVIGAVVAMFLAAHVVDARGTKSKPKVEVLLSTDKTIIGQPIAYPASAQAKVTAVIVTMEPGQETGWHEHSVPLFGRVLEGELTVDYGPQGKRIYKTGDVLVEALNTAHNGRNTGTGTMRIVAVFTGAEGVQNSAPVSAPK